MYAVTVPEEVTLELYCPDKHTSQGIWEVHNEINRFYFRGYRGMQERQGAISSRLRQSHDVLQPEAPPSVGCGGQQVRCCEAWRHCSTYNVADARLCQLGLHKIDTLFLYNRNKGLQKRVQSAR